MSIDLYRENGEIRPFRNSEYLPFYYFLPKSVLARLPAELQRLPRHPMRLVDDSVAVAAVESDVFVKAVWAATGVIAWPAMGRKDFMEDYSGFDPAYCFAHWTPVWVEGLQKAGYLQTDYDLFSAYKSPYDIWCPPDEYVAEVMAEIAPAVMERYHMQEVIAEAERSRCFEDFDDRNSKRKIDLYRKWYRPRSKHPQISLEVFQEKYQEEHDGQEWDAPDEAPNHDVEAEAVTHADTELFLSTLTEKDQQILKLRLEGWPLERIAEKLGYQNHSGVLKRIRKIGQAFERFAGVDYGFDQQKIT